MILGFQTERSGQTVQTQIRMLLMEQSDQGLHCLQLQIILLLKNGERLTLPRNCSEELGIALWNCKYCENEPPHGKTNKMACALSEDTDQPTR